MYFLWNWTATLPTPAPYHRGYTSRPVFLLFLFLIWVLRTKTWVLALCSKYFTYSAGFTHVSHGPQGHTFRWEHGKGKKTQRGYRTGQQLSQPSQSPGKRRRWWWDGMGSLCPLWKEPKDILANEQRKVSRVAWLLLLCFPRLWLQNQAELILENYTVKCDLLSSGWPFSGRGKQLWSKAR